MSDTTTTKPDYEVLADDLPEHVVRAVADAVTPQEIGAHDSAISELVHRVMVVTYQAAVPDEHRVTPIPRLAYLEGIGTAAVTLIGAKPAAADALTAELLADLERAVRRVPRTGDAG